jgi:hypothetical protein
MQFSNHHKTWNERKEMDHSKEEENEKFGTRSVEQVEYCSCCGEEMTRVEVLESYLDQSIEQALEVCGALGVEYGSAHQIGLLGRIADSLVRAATLTEAARLIPEGE